MLPPMRFFTPALVIVAVTLCFNSAQASPANSGDDMDKLLAERGLLTQMD